MRPTTREYIAVPAAAFWLRRRGSRPRRCEGYASRNRLRRGEFRRSSFGFEATTRHESGGLRRADLFGARRKWNGFMRFAVFAKISAELAASSADVRFTRHGLGLTNCVGPRSNVLWRNQNGEVSLAVSILVKTRRGQEYRVTIARSVARAGQGQRSPTAFRAPAPALSQIDRRPPQETTVRLLRNGVSPIGALETSSMQRAETSGSDRTFDRPTDRQLSTPAERSKRPFCGKWLGFLGTGRRGRT